MSLLAYLTAPFSRIFHSVFRHMHNPRQAEINNMHLQMANGKVPPAWGPEREREYAFRFFESDVLLWTLATDLPAAQQGPALALRLTGAARDLIREFDVNQLVNGQVIADPNAPMGQRQISGVEALLRVLRRRFAPLDQENQLFALSEFFNFSKQGHEDTDQLVSRYELTWHRCNQIGQAQLNEVCLSWMLLHHSRIPKDRWPLILAPTQGNLPSNQQEYQAFVAYLRRNGHLYDRHSDAAKNVSHQTFWTADSDSAPNDNADHTSLFSQSFPEFAAFGHSDDSESFADTDSSCCSHDTDSEVDFSDLYGQDFTAVAETVYLNYRHAKRRWRSFANPRRNPKGKGRGKGMFRRRQFSAHGKGGKGHSSTLFSADSSDLATQWSFFGGKGKGKGKGKTSSYYGRKNPLDRSGKRMLCSVCNSDEHFRARCPKNPQASQNPGATKSFFGQDSLEAIWNAQSSAFQTNPTSNSQAPAPSVTNPVSSGKRTIYLSSQFADVPKPQTPTSSILFADGSVEVLRPRNFLSTDDDSHASPDTQHKSLAMYPWWHVVPTAIPDEPDLSTEPCYHSLVRLKRGEALVIDTGAVFSLSGDGFAQRLLAEAHKHGHGGVLTQHPKPYSIEGVGKGTNTVSEMIKSPIALQNGQIAEYHASVIPNSECPGLLGLQPMRKQRVLLDLFNERYISVGPGGYELKLSPGSVSLPTEFAPTGHLMLPISNWQQIKGRSEMIFHADASHVDTAQPQHNQFPLSLQSRAALLGESQFEPNYEDDPSIDAVPHDVPLH